MNLMHINIFAKKKQNRWSYNEKEMQNFQMIWGKFSKFLIEILYLFILIFLKVLF
jgi:hypothetical protein